MRAMDYPVAIDPFLLPFPWSLVPHPVTRFLLRPHAALCNNHAGVPAICVHERNPALAAAAICAPRLDRFDSLVRMSVCDLDTLACAVKP